ncbi:hypothetical protein SDC9_88644 [bioreactor metagenome]|uniref:Uncharacterized protein n=1 Tax=bioreactor metagenome TaxID=1076179 RepID=A0A644ZMD1_9ZZZZ
MSDLNLCLPCPYGLNDDIIKPGRIKNLYQAGGGCGQTANGSARGHRADENARIAGQISHAYPVT